MNASLCDYCSFRCGLKSQLVKHLFEAHSSEADFNYTCSMGGCAHFFQSGSKYSSFLSHVNRKHPNWQSLLNSVDPTHTAGMMDVGQGDSGALTHGNSIVGYDDHPLSLDNETSMLSPTFTGVTNVAAQFLLILKEQHHLSQSAIDFTVASVNELVGHVCKKLKYSVEEVFQENEITTMGDIDKCFESFTSPLDGLATEYQQNKFYREYLGLVVRVLNNNYVCMLYIINV